MKQESELYLIGVIASSLVIILIMIVLKIKGVL